jgi:NAD(P)-dependent dehydrogenase (short-subunit alcohol dehydrogenase family)
MGERLKGRVCVITGAGSGIGRACALRFGGEGARVAVADIAAEAGQAVVGEVEAAGGEAGFFAADVSDEATVARLYEEVEARFGAVHVLVNNAGVLLHGDESVLDTELAVWERALAINLTGVFLCCKHGIPKILAAGGGSVINMGSISGLVGSATSQIAYAASKGGVIAMTRDIAVEFAKRNVRANAICPGPVETPLAMQVYGGEENWQRRRIHIPTGALGRPEDIADAALYLAGEESRWVTGTCLVVDGGISVAYTTPED